MLFLVMFKWTLYYLLEWNKFSVKKQNTIKYWEMEKNWKITEFCQSGKMGTMFILSLHWNRSRNYFYGTFLPEKNDGSEVNLLKNKLENVMASVFDKLPPP